MRQRAMSRTSRKKWFSTDQNTQRSQQLTNCFREKPRGRSERSAARAEWQSEAPERHPRFSCRKNDFQWPIRRDADADPAPLDQYDGQRTQLRTGVSRIDSILEQACRAIAVPGCSQRLSPRRFAGCRFRPNSGTCERRFSSDDKHRSIPRSVCRCAPEFRATGRSSRRGHCQSSRHERGSGARRSEITHTAQQRSTDSAGSSTARPEEGRV